MDIGFVANSGFVAIGPVEGVLKQAARLGYDGVELCFSWGSPCDLETWTADDTSRLRDLVAATGVKVLSIASFWARHVSPDPAARERARTEMARAIDLASQLGTAVATCMALGDLTVPPDKQVPLFGEVFGEYARRAEDHGVRIGIENWPGVRTENGIQISNLAYSPEMFERLFDAVPSKAVGLEYDPSHLVWQGCDPVRPIRQFADRLVTFHAKDTQILKETLDRTGIYGRGWRCYRLPGMGQIDWNAMANALAEVGYRAGIIIEHEDHVFSGQRFDEGLAVGLKFLRQVLRH